MGMRCDLKSFFNSSTIFSLSDCLSIGRSFKLHNTVCKLSKDLKHINNGFTDVKQIRTSVIIHWLKQNGLRKTQYLAGHKYISSTERYQQDDLQSLRETINNFDPFS